MNIAISSGRALMDCSTIDGLISARAHRRSDDTAICAWDGLFTYGELEALSGMLARHLQNSPRYKTRGQVPIIIGHGKWAPVAMLAVLKTGKAFVAIDETLPLAYQKQIVEQLDTSTIIVACRNGGWDSDIQQVVVGEEWLGATCERAKPFSSSSKPQDEAFVMFTSGSSGTPSGVVIQHCAMAAAVRAYQTHLQLGLETRMLQVTSFTWLPCTVEIFATLICGGQICIPSQQDITTNLAAFMESHRINTAVMTPSMLSTLNPDELPSLKVLGIGGERLKQVLIDTWAAKVQLIMAYGSTETNLCLIQHIEPGPFRFGAMPIGCQAWIVDVESRRLLLARGEVGELIIESDMVALRYLAQSQKTTSKLFDQAPWLDMDETGPRVGRFCATGDLACLDADGCVILQGRIDSTFKIRGQKVVPEHTANVIQSLIPDHITVSVQSLDLPKSGQDRSLVAFFGTTNRNDHGPGDVSVETRQLLSKVQDELRNRLPQHLCPLGIVAMEKLPLTTSGKVDVIHLATITSGFTAGRLPGYEGVKMSTSKPTTPTEKLLQHLWCKHLDLPDDAICLEDFFVPLGGDSLRAIHVNSELRRLGYTIPNYASVQSLDLRDQAARIQVVPSRVSSIEPFGLIESTRGAGAIIEDLASLLAASARSPGSYTAQLVVELDDACDVQMFKKAWRLVADEIDILRTTFYQSPSYSVQVQTTAPLQWHEEVSELQHYLEKDDDSALELSLETLRFAIVTARKYRYFVFTAHHAVLDAWTASRLFRLVTSAYHGARVSPALPYRNYMKYLCERDQDKLESFWRTYLSGAVVPDFPAVTTKNRSSLARESTKRSIQTGHSVNDKVTLACIIHAAWAICLHIYTQSDDITFGTVLSGRAGDLIGIEDVLGPTIVTVPCRIAIDPARSIAGYLEDVGTSLAKLAGNDQLTLHEIARIDSECYRACQLRTLLNVQLASGSVSPTLCGQPVSVASWDRSSEHTMLECVAEDASLQCELSFDVDILSSSQAALLLGHFEAVLEHLISAHYREKTVQDMDALTPSDHVIISRQTTVPLTVDTRCIHEVISQKLLTQPDRNAIEAWDRSFTHAELELASTQLAREIRARNLAPGNQILPVLMDKSAWVAVAMLAVLKAGAAFILFDTAHPEAWIQQVTRDVQATTVLTSASCADRLTCIPDRIIVETSAPCGSDATVDEALPHVHSGSSAFISYTSGTTGQPKLIPHTHSAYLSGLAARLPHLRRDRDSRVIQFASFAFDVAVEDILTTLIAGGTVCIPSEHERINDLYGFFQRFRVTDADLTPSLVSTLDPVKLDTLKVLILGGERLQHVHRDQWADKVILLNGYGPSEIAIASHVKQVKSGDDPSNLGRSHGCNTWITRPDDPQRLQLVGAIGEIILEGPNLTCGYLNNPLQTEQAFIADLSWASGDGRRFYRTGDLARLNPDGSICIIGRKDNQTKLRGQRIELNFVESCVRQYLQDCDELAAEVLALRVSSETSSLVVFATWSDGVDRLRTYVTQRITQLRAALEAELPAHMVPSALIPLERLPLGTTGKLDRRALREIGSTIPLGDVLFISRGPHDQGSIGHIDSPRETVLAELFAKVLKIPCQNVGRSTHFFHAGGDSVLAMQLVALASGSPHQIGLTVQLIFNHPILCDLAERIEGSAILLPSVVEPFELLDRKGYDLNQIAATCDVGLHQIEDVYPCSPLQADLMAISVANPPFYISSQALPLHSTVDVHHLERAWQQLVKETPILRTRIVQTESDMLQVVLKHESDLSCERRLTNTIFKDIGRSMTEGKPLMRYAIRSDSTRATFELVIHHALYDGWSLDLIFERLSQLYLGSTATTQLASYSLFIKYLSQMDASASREFWRSYFQHSAATSTIFPNLSRESTISRTLDSFDMTIQVPNYSRSSFTLATVLQAAWAVVVSSYTSSQDIVFGTTRTGRDAPVPSIQNIAGPTFATVPIRVAWQDDETVDSMLSMTQAQTVEGSTHQHIGLQTIKAISKDAAAACNFSTLLVVQVQHQRPLNDVLFADHTMLGDISHFNPTDLMLQFTQEIDSSISINASYNSAILEATQLRRMLLEVEWVASHLVSANAHDGLVRDLEVLTNEDIANILSYNDGGIVPPAKVFRVHDLIQAQVESHPETVAVEAWDGTMTYAQLDDHSSRLAHKLREDGMMPEHVVLLHFEKTCLIVVSMLAVWKAGASFVMLDPAHPSQRLQHISKEVMAEVILTTSPTTLASLAHNKVVVEVSWDFLLALPLGGAALPLGSPRDVACMIFTSGSTGVPKGIVLQHQALATSMLAHGPAFGLDSASRVYQFASFAFDMALYDICTTLVMGGCVCIPSESDRLNRLAESLTAMGCNWAFFTPSTLSTFQPSDVPTLKTVVIGGEFVGQETVDTWLDGVELYQCSGPAETTTCIGGRMLHATPRNCIGRPLGSLCWVVDQNDHNRLVPPGAVGEMLIEGPTLARGYLHDRHADQFVTASDMRWTAAVLGTGHEDRRMYKTGDLIRKDVDGTLRILGRKDRQVKLRGQRIELSEVEHQIRQHSPDLKVVALVITPRDGNQAAELMAFLSTHFKEPKQGAVGESCHTIPATEDLNDVQRKLESVISEKLPNYMTPTRYIWLDRIPLNSSSKIDRKALQDFGLGLSVLDLAGFDNCPHADSHDLTGGESVLREMWSVVLKLDKEHIKSTSDFIVLGGDSITAMRLAAVARKRGKQLSVQSIFKHRRLKDMAQRMLSSDALDTQPGAEMRTYQRGLDPQHIRHMEEKYNISEDVIEDLYPATPLQEGLMYSSMNNPGVYTAQDIFEVRSGVDLDRFKAACAEVIRASSILKTCLVDLSGGGLHQLVLRRSTTWHHDENLESYLALDKARPVLLGQPLVRWALVTEGSRMFFVWTRHHASYDGVSFALTLSAIENAYTTPYTTSNDAKTSLKGFVKHIALHLEESKGFWSTRLSHSGSAHYPLGNSISSPNDETRMIGTTISLVGLVKSSFTLPTMVRAALGLTLMTRLGSSEAIFGEILSGRDDTVDGIEELLAPTFCSVPMHVRAEANQTIVDYLQNVQQFYVDMLPHQHIGLQSIMRLGTEHRKACQFRTLLSIQGQSHAARDNSILEAIRSESHAAFYTHPLTLSCEIGDNGITVDTTHFPDLVSGEEVNSMLRQFSHILRQLLTSERAGSLADIDLVSAPDLRDMQLRNQESRIAEVPQCIHALFMQHARCYPHDLALVADGISWTYAELDQTSDRLASYLRTCGIRTGQTIPSYIGKSLWFVVALLGIMKAGGAMVGLDPEHQAARTEVILGELGARLVISTAAYSQLIANLGTDIINLDDTFIQTCPAEATFPCPPVSPDTPAMVVFTSGTTGNPKGIVLEHLAICTAMSVQAPALGIERGTRTLHFSSPAWDVLIAEVLMPLTRGGTVCIPTDDDRNDNLPVSTRKLQPDWMLLTPRTLGLFKPTDFPSVRTMVTGGEKADTAILATWDTLGDAFINIYGPAECSLFCIYNPDHGATRAPERLGSGLTAQLWVVDPDNHDTLLPPGCTGELLVEGPVLAKGYLNDPARTEAAFITDPKWAREAARSGCRRLYKTGDLVRQNHDGTFDFVGRKDNQIKISSQRFEPDEVEAALKSSLPDNWQVLVDKFQSTPDSAPFLAAFMTASDDAFIDRVRSDIKEELPRFMQPSLYVPVNRLPLNANQKLDRAALRRLLEVLPPSELDHFRQSRQAGRAPAGQNEVVLANAWCFILGAPVDTIRATDTFFGRGGDSILAMRLVGYLRDRDFTLTVKEIFRSPVLSNLALAMKPIHAIDDGPGYHRFAMLPAADHRKFIKTVVCPQLGCQSSQVVDIYPTTAYQEQAIAAGLRMNRGLMGYFLFSARGGCDLDRFQDALNKTTASCEMLRTRFVQCEGSLLQVVMAMESIVLECYETHEETRRVARTICARDLERPLHLSDKSLKFFIINNNDTKEHTIVIRLSHAQYDGLCVPSIWQSISDHYEAKARRPNSSTFPAYVQQLRASQPADWKEYWQSYLRDSSPSSLVNHQQPNYPLNIRALPKAVRKLPLHPNTSRSHTTATYMRTAWALTLIDLLQIPNATFLVTIAGRNLPLAGIDTVVGACINIIPVRISLRPEQTTHQLLSQVQSQLSDTIPYELTSLRDIIKHCTPWPSWVKFGSIFQHDDHISSAPAFRLGDVGYETASFCRPAEMAHVAVHTAVENERVVVGIVSLCEAIGEGHLRVMVDKFEEKVGVLYGEERVVGMDLQEGRAVFPLPANGGLMMTTEGSGEVGEGRQSSAGLRNSDEAMVARIRTNLQELWKEALRAERGTVYQLTDSFFDVGGDLVSAAYLATSLQRQGYGVVVEDVLQRHTFKDQAVMLAGMLTAPGIELEA
ncbi:hypothetical protein BDZ85DRAFT_317296 [Elsinoe ampelina]|uniref:Carrier domain-containing protein n=1 Tax=Elsinoe ampelina TaxID=302913 RepID=A0A6A6GKD3_9PEZI|nr:hypothetical protein BDZ85DRAFT_317296 [Elsinoe ampelina]